MTRDSNADDSTLERFVILTGARNVRDVGGYPAGQGAATVWRRVYRADSLHALTDDDQSALRARGIRTIIDLRRADEAETEPNVFRHAADIEYRHIPILEAAVSSSAMQPAQPVDDLSALYRLILDHYQLKLRQVFEIMAETAPAPVLIHCSAGKDRTGLVIALLLALAGVPESVIAQDYELTRERIAPLLERFRQRAIERGFNLQRHERMLACEAATMQQTLQYLTVQYGGAMAYLQTIGLSSDTIRRLQNLILGA